MSVRNIFGHLLDSTGLKKYFIKYLLYNKRIRFVFDVVNKYRWREIELAVILWPPAYKLFDSIQRDISEQYDVKLAFDFKLKKNKFSKFVYDLYQIDYASPNKINMKVEPLQRDPMFMRYLIVIIPRPTMSCEDILNRVKCRDVNKLKMAIRDKYKHKINDYIYDLIIHSTEADYQNKEVRKLIELHSEEIKKHENS